MYYISWADVTAKYKVIAKEKAESEITPYILGAEADVDSALAIRYATPFTPGSSNAPYIVRDLCVDLTYCKIMWAQKGTDKLLEATLNRLNSLAAGSGTITTSAGPIAASADIPAWTDRPYRSSFGSDGPENWSVSEQWQVDDANSRTGD